MSFSSESIGPIVCELGKGYTHMGGGAHTGGQRSEQPQLPFINFDVP